MSVGCHWSCRSGRVSGESEARLNLHFWARPRWRLIRPGTPRARRTWGFPANWPRGNRLPRAGRLMLLTQPRRRYLARASPRKFVEREQVGDGAAEAGKVRLFEQTIAISAPAAVFRVVGDTRNKLAWVPVIKRVEMHAGTHPWPECSLPDVLLSRPGRVCLSGRDRRMAAAASAGLPGRVDVGPLPETCRVEPVPGGSLATRGQDLQS